MSLENVFQPLIDKISATTKLKLFGLAKVPLIFAVNPKVLTLNDNLAEVEIPLGYKTKNHLNSMYFGALSIGADCVVAAHALQIASSYKSHKVIPVFKDFHADFIKRAEDNVVFSCKDGAKIKALIDKAIATGERATGPIDAYAYTPNLGTDPVAKFTLGLSIKAKLIV